MAERDIARAVSGAGLRASPVADGAGAQAGQQADQVVGDLYEANGLGLIRVAKPDRIGRKDGRASPPAAHNNQQLGGRRAQSTCPGDRKIRSLTVVSQSPVRWPAVLGCQKPGRPR